MESFDGMGGLPFPRTKFYAPVLRPGCVPRPLLWERLTAGIYRKMTVVCAPPGAGKSTLAAHWLAAHSIEHVWFSVEARDDEPGRLFRAMMAAFSPYLSAYSSELQDVVSKAIANGEWQHATSSFLNILFSKNEPFVWVLDDFHVFGDSGVFSLMEQLIERWPPNGHILLLTRKRPNLPLARWLARDEMAEFGAESLSFSVEEARDFLQQTMQLQIDERDCALLHEKTEGWITGLQLAGLSLPGFGSVAALHEGLEEGEPYLSEYLTREVFASLSEAHQSFLLRCSIVDRCCGPLANALAGCTQGTSLLRKLESENLFLVAISPRRYWFRFHHLFRAWLMHRVEEVLGPELPSLHRVASLWFAKEGAVMEALHHAMLANDEELAVELLSPQLETMQFHQAFQTIMQLTGILSVATRIRHPVVVAYHLWACLGYNHWTAAHDHELAVATESLLSTVEQDSLLDVVRATSLAHEVPSGVLELSFVTSMKLHKTGDMSLGREWLESLVEPLFRVRPSMGMYALTALSSHPQWLHHSGALERVRELTLEVPEQSLVLSELLVLLDAWGCYDKADLARASALARQVYERALPSGLPPFVSWQACSLLSLFSWERGDVEEARRWLFRAASYDLEKSAWHWSRHFYTLKSLLLFEDGDVTGAYATLAEANDLQRGFSYGPFDPIALMTVVFDWLQGDFTSLWEWVARSGLSAEDTFALNSDEHELAYHLFWLTLFYEQRFEEAQRLLDTMRSQAQELGLCRVLIVHHLMQAMLCDYKSEEREAIEEVKSAFRLAAHGEMVRVFVPYEASLKAIFVSLLRAPEWLQKESSSTFVNKLIGLLPEVQRALESHSKTKAVRVSESGDIVQLSRREREVLQVVSEGLTYKEIATKLHISMETVKQHMKNIFQKLQVNKRGQAVSRARALSLLED